MSTILKNILTFDNLLVGVPVSQPHGLNVFTSVAVPVIPNLVVPSMPGFTITADTINVTVERTIAGGAAINVYVEHWHTIEAALPLPGQLAGLMPFVASGGGGVAPVVPATIIVEDEGVALPGNPFTTLDFAGAGVTASNLGGGVAQILIPNGSTIIVEDEGVALPGNPFTTLDFVGGGVVATDLGGGVAQLAIPGFSLAHQFTVAMGGDPDYTSIKAAVDAAILAGASVNNPYNVLVSAGVYIEDPFTVPAGVIVSSESSVGDGVIVIANNPAADLVTMAGGILYGLLFEGVTDPVRALIRVAAGGLNRIWACRWRRCSTGVAVSGATTILGMINCGISILAPGQHVTTGLLVSAGAHVGVANFSALVPPAIAAIYAPANAIDAVFSVTAAFIEVASSSFNVKGATPTQTGFLADDGAQCDLVGVEISNCKLGLVVGSVGVGTDIRMIGSAMAGNTTNVTISSATGSLLFGNISIDADTRNIVPGGSFTGNFLNHTTGSSTAIGEQFFEWPTGQDLRLPTFFHYVASTGIDTGGVVTATGGLGISVALGTGMIQVQPPTENVRNVTWATTPLVLPDNTTSYVYYDGASDLIVSGLAPPGTSNILLATIVTKAGAVFFRHNTSWTGDTAWDRWVQYLVDVRKIRVANGLIATQGSTVRNLNISNGLWYRAMTPLTYAGGVDVTWSYFYGTNGVSEVPGQTLLDITSYDNAGVLTAMTPAWWRQDLLILTGDDRISVLYGVAEFATELAAQGTPSPPIPTFMEETATPLALVLVQQGLGLTKILDVRPLDTGGSGVSSVGVTSHSALSNLLADDHPQYLLVDGTRALTGTLQLGGNDIITVGTVNGVTVEAHAVRHEPGGADALATGTPVATLVGVVPSDGVAASFARADHQHGVAAGIAPANVTKAAAAEGTSSSVARADHKHDIDTAIVVTIGTANAEGASTSLARADHVHDHGAQALGTGTQHAVATPLVAGFESAADKTKLDGIAPGATNTPLSAVAPVDVTKAAAAVGVSASAARSDHKHDITTAAPSATGVGTASAEGVATTLARSDHAHQSNTAPVNVTKAAAVIGTSGEPARADHKHDIATAAVATIGSANTEGASTSLSRADHVHDHGAQTVGTMHAAVIAAGASGFMTGADKTKLDGIAAGAGPSTPLAAVAPADVTKSVAVIGLSTSAARADHKHDITTAVAGSISVGDAAAEGAATTLARSDHTHALSAPAAPANVTKAAASAGIALTVARADHKHDVSTAAAVAVGAANAEGVASTLARSDHAHQVTGLAIAAQAQGDVLYFNGAAWVRLAPGVAGQVLQTNGPAANPAWVSSGIFGTQFQNAESLAASSTPSAGYINKLTLVTPAIPASSYMVEWSYTLGNNNLVSSSRGRVIVDGVTTLQEIQPSDSLANWKVAGSGQALVVLTAGIHTIAIDYSRVSGGTATIKDARLLIWRVA